MANLTAEKVKELLSQPQKVSQIAKEYQVTRQAVYKILFDFELFKDWQEEMGGRGQIFCI